MKKIFSWNFLLTLLFASNIVSAQNSESSENGVNKYNLIKVNLTAIPLRNYHFQYERILNRKFSVSLGLGFLPTGSLPFKSSIENAVDPDPNEKRLIEEARVGGFTLTPEIRFYLGKKGYGRGFYVAPYYRYSTFKLEELSFDYNGGLGTKTVKLKGDITAHSGGLLLGAQWFLGKSVSLDWWILGIHYGSGRGTFTGTPATPFTPLEQMAIENEIKNTDLPFGATITAKATTNNITATVTGPWAGLRGAITLGIRF
ncbi:MAG TPA: DUF3575 domain-containing protein [Chitinophagaceae bacterium]|nr:DUF3575 domain-containing protein [Chitinophagaceae bacterium]